MAASMSMNVCPGNRQGVNLRHRLHYEKSSMLGRFNCMRVEGRITRGAAVPKQCSASPHAVLELVYSTPPVSLPDPSSTTTSPPKPSKVAPPRPKWNFFQRAAAAALDAVEDGVIANMLERNHPPLYHRPSRTDCRKLCSRG
ncbi:hypothetical protein HPP92_013568 [Vanilla planifolia]|uniref:Uncharacterized protein n=1 Tax=Vanilla planifolia TaxID=51239 RepID=A0A835QUA2_VANPL|nr:hypothetical protein HPP92_013568 [Vanilla planifolia]